MRLSTLFLVVLLSACANTGETQPTPTDYPPPGTFPKEYKRQMSRQPDALSDMGRDARAIRSIINNIMGIKRDISR